MTTTDYGWVARDLSRRLRSEYGTYQAVDWERFCRERRIYVRWHQDQDRPDGYHADIEIDGVQRRCIWLRVSMSAAHTALCAWHEIAHILGVPLNAPFWESLPWGKPMVPKLERRAEEFARLYPVWPTGWPSFLPN